MGSNLDYKGNAGRSCRESGVIVEIESVLLKV
jgi:hypothetical protein